MKKIVSLTIILVVCLTTTVNILAANGPIGDTDITRSIPYTETEEDIAVRLIKEKELLARFRVKANPVGIYLTLNIPVFQQQNNYYCGPATVKQVIHYFNGSSETQSDYARYLGTTSAGTTMGYIPGVVSSRISYTYSQSAIGTYGQWLQRIILNSENNRPVILDINTNNVPAIPYSSDGHFVNTSGIDTTGLDYKVRITDPWTDGLGNRWYYAADLYKANNDHKWQSFIY